MRLTKAQFKIVEQMNNGAWIWVASGFPYLAVKNAEIVKSEPINLKTFKSLVELDIIKEREGKWYIQ